MKWRSSVLVFLTGLCAFSHCLPRQYHFIGSTLPWSEAQTYCRERYTDLATVSDIDEMNQLVNTAQDSTGGFTEKAWIGLHGNISSWRWSLSDRRHYTNNEDEYKNWDSAQPDNLLGDQMCVRMRKGGLWDDFQCDWRMPFVCYSDATNVSQRFIFVEKARSWSEAQRYCRETYTDLASVRNQKENEEIQRLTKYRGSWIGLYRRQEWSDQSNSKFFHWKYGQPDNVGGKQNCTATDLGNAGLWSDEQCSEKLAFICYGEEKKISPVLSTTTSTSTTVTPNKITTTEGHPSSTEIPSPEQPSATTLDQTESKHVINLKVTLTSKMQLSEDDIKDLVSVQFHNLLRELGLPESIKVSLKSPLK